MSVEYTPRGYIAGDPVGAAERTVSPYPRAGEIEPQNPRLRQAGYSRRSCGGQGLRAGARLSRPARLCGASSCAVTAWRRIASRTVVEGARFCGCPHTR